MKVLHFKHKMWLKDWFPSILIGLVIKKRLHLTYIYRTYMRTFEQEGRSIEGVEVPDTASPEVQ